jgi:hypothetical protein
MNRYTVTEEILESSKAKFGQVVEVEIPCF